MALATTGSFRYQVDASLTAIHAACVERQASLDLYEHLKGCDYCFVFNSRQMGKSSLRVRVMRRLQAEGVICDLINPQTHGTSPREEQGYAGNSKELIKQVGLADRISNRDHLLLSYGGVHGQRRNHHLITEGKSDSDVSTISTSQENAETSKAAWPLATEPQAQSDSLATGKRISIEFTHCFHTNHLAIGKIKQEAWIETRHMLLLVLHKSDFAVTLSLFNFMLALNDRAKQRPTIASPNAFHKDIVTAAFDLLVNMTLTDLPASFGHTTRRGVSSSLGLGQTIFRHPAHLAQPGCLNPPHPRMAV